MPYHIHLTQYLYYPRTWLLPSCHVCALYSNSDCPIVWVKWKVKHIPNRSHQHLLVAWAIGSHSLSWAALPKLCFTQCAFMFISISLVHPCLTCVGGGGGGVSLVPVSLSLCQSIQFLSKWLWTPFSAARLSQVEDTPPSTSPLSLRVWFFTLTTFSQGFSRFNSSPFSLLKLFTFYYWL